MKNRFFTVNSRCRSSRKQEKGKKKKKGKEITGHDRRIQDTIGDNRTRIQGTKRKERITALIFKMAVFCDVAPYSLVDIGRRFYLQR
jgi:hypothetical protein